MLLLLPTIKYLLVFICLAALLSRYPIETSMRILFYYFIMDSFILFPSKALRELYVYFLYKVVFFYDTQITDNASKALATRK